MRIQLASLGILCTASFAMSCRDSTSSDMKAGRDVTSFQKQADGSYAVICSDGLKEIVSEADLISNKVCQLSQFPYIIKSRQDTFLFSEDGEQDNCALAKDQTLRFGTKDAPLSVGENHIVFRVPAGAAPGCALEKALVLKDHVSIGQHLGTKIVWDVDPPQEGVAGLFGDPETTLSSASGSLSLGPISDLVGLSSGWLLVGDVRSNKVLKINAITGAVAEEYQLTVAPGRMVLDEATGVLYVSTRTANKLVRINLLKKTIEHLPLPAPALDLALAGQGRVFWISSTGISMLNAQGQIASEWKTQRSPSLVAYDRSGKNLVVYTGSLQRYRFDEEKLTLEPQEEVYANNVATLALSADGTQLAAPAGGGNGNGYSIVDFSPQNLNQKNGEWNVGAYPTAAAFFSQRDLFAAHNRETLKLFNRTTHALVKEIRISNNGCGYNYARNIAISHQEKLVFVVSQCGFDADSGAIFWAKVD